MLYLPNTPVRGMYVHLMGHSTTPLHIHAVKLAQSPTLLHRYETVLAKYSE
jgi:hypothetical protein